MDCKDRILNIYNRFLLGHEIFKVNILSEFDISECVFKDDIRAIRNQIIDLYEYSKVIHYFRSEKKYKLVDIKFLDNYL